MDNKNSDDSGGSDSLDKSLQKKCIVDDSGDGSQSDRSAVEMLNSDVSPIGHDKEAAKTDVATEDCGSSYTHQPDLSAAVAANSSSSTAMDIKVKQISYALIGPCLWVEGEAAAATAEAGILLPQAKETTTVMCEKIALEDDISPSNSSSTEVEQETAVDEASPSGEILLTTEDFTQLYGALTVHRGRTGNKPMLNDADDANNSSRSKKVHFHPEVKEHDGGKRLISKKKEKYERWVPTRVAGSKGATEDEVKEAGEEVAGEEEQHNEDVYFNALLEYIETGVF